jgi:glycosyltransferase involved in cell wall biosynthesis
VRILFYVDPLVELGRPLMKGGWVLRAQQLAELLLATGWAPSDIKIVAGEALIAGASAGAPGVAVVGLPQRLFVPGMGPDSLQIALGRYRDSLPKDVLQRVVDPLRAALGDFEPDLAVSFSPAPELRLAWSRIVVLHHEYGPFSRAPYTETYYFDPIGMFKHSAVARHAEQIHGWSPTPNELAVVEQVRAFYRPKVAQAASPMTQLIAPRREQYRRLHLLVLQFSDFYGYDAHATYRSQFDLLIATLEQTAPEDGLLVTEHPEHPVLDQASVQALQRRYRNLIWDPAFRGIYGVSQCALELVDTVVTVSSSVGWQAALWGKRLIVPGSSHLDLVADSHELAALSKIQEIDVRWKDRVLAWLLNRYYVPGEVLRSPGWLAELITYWQRANSEDLEAFRPQASPRRITEGLCRASSLSPITVKQEGSPETPLFVYFADRGDAFTDQKRQCFLYPKDGWSRLQLPLPAAVERWRIDLGTESGVWVLEEVDAASSPSVTIDHVLETSPGIELLPLGRQIALVCPVELPWIIFRAPGCEDCISLRIRRSGMSEVISFWQHTRCELRERERALTQQRDEERRKDLQKYAEAKEAMREAHKDLVDNLRVEHEKEVGRLREERQKELLEVQARHAVELEQLQHRSEVQLREEQARLRHAYEQLNALADTWNWKYTSPFRSYLRRRGERWEQLIEARRHRHRFNVEQPAPGFLAVSSNPVRVNGWFVDERGLPARAVRVRNGASIHVCRVTERADVASHFRDRWPELSERVGFQSEVPTGWGPRRLVIEAETQDGERVRLGQYMLRVGRYRPAEEQLAMPGDDETYPCIFDTATAPKPEVNAIAFFLPQYHRILENDRWWGDGFTEWTNVRPAQPQFADHYQPHVPHLDIGYYDLGDPSVLERQAAMARAAGIYGFCYYYYWFGGKRLLERPLEAMLASGRPEMPFCYCWANENWSRRWDGREREVLIAQCHSMEDDLAVISDIARAFADRRYIRTEDKPLLLIYRPALLPDCRTTIERWRDWGRANSIGEIYVAGVKGFGCNEPVPFGLDALVEFPPNDSGAHELAHATVSGAAGFDGKLFDYREVRANCLAAQNLPFPLYRGVMPSWDNTARRKTKGSVFLKSTPGAYANWLARAAALTKKLHPPEQRFLFINAWNEWAEGCHLEPDQQFGYAWLNATRRVLGSWTVSEDESNRPVLFISHDFAYAGAQLLLLRILRWFRAHSRRAFEVLMAVPRRRESHASALEQELLASFRSLATVHFLDEDGQAENAACVAAGHYSLVYANTCTLGPLLARMQPICCPVISHVHELRYWIEERMPAGAIQQLDTMVTRYVACSRAVADNLIRRQAISADKVETIHAFTSLARADETTRTINRAEARAALEISQDCFLVVACGTLDWRKGPDLLVEAAAHFRRKQPSIHCRFVWIGSPTSTDEMDRLQSEVARLQLSNIFSFAGPMRDPLPWMLAADVFALPSREDPFPLVMLEAASLARPIVAFAESGGAAELLEDGAGLLARQGAPADLADCLARFAGDPQLRQRCGELVARRVRKLYSEEVLAPRLLDCIENVITNASPRLVAS